jgi:hypothetical protein
MINSIVRDWLHTLVTSYLDDVCVYNRTLEEHHENLRLLLQRFKEGGLETVSQALLLQSSSNAVPKSLKFAALWRSTTSTPSISLILTTLRLR